MAQNRTIDSLLNVYGKSQNAEEKVDLQSKISQAYTEIGDLKKGGEYADKALKGANAIGDTRRIGLAYYTFARLNQYMRDWDNALLYHYQAIQQFDEVDAKEELAWSYLNMGIAFEAKKDFERAIRYDNKALQIFKKIKQKQGEAYSYLNLGLAHYGNGNADSSFLKLKEAEELCIKLGDQKGVGYVLNIRGDIFLQIGKLDEALKENLECARIQEGESDKRGLAIVYGRVGKIYLKQKNLKLAEDALKTGELRGLDVEASLPLRDLYLTWSQLDSLNANFKAAYFHLKAHNKYADIVTNEDREREIVALKYAFSKDLEEQNEESAKAMQEIEQQLRDAEFESSLNKNKFLLALSVGAVFVILLLIGLMRKNK